MNNLSTSIEFIPDLACVKTLDGVYTHCNHKFLNTFGKKREEVIGKTDFELFGYEDALQFAGEEKEMIEHNTNQSFKTAIKIANKQIHYFQATKELIYDDEQNATAFFCIARDTTLEKQYEFIYEDSQTILEYIATENNLHKTLEKIIEYAELRSDSSICSILLLDEDKKHLLNGAAPSLPEFYNKAIDGIEIGENIGSCGSAAYKKERVIVKDIDSHQNWQPYLSLTQKANLHSCWSEPIISSDNEVLGSFAIYHREAKAPSTFELKIINSYAHLAAVAIEKQRHDKQIQQKDLAMLEQEKKSNKILKAREKEIKEKNEKLEELALTDYLTGLYNRSKIDEVLEYHINHAKRYETGFGVIMIDIDFFKEVNDTYGHQAGDLVLQEFAKILKNNARITDTVGRWGGEEFLVILEQISESNLLQVANKLRTTIEGHNFPVAGHKTASFGTTLYQENDTAETLIEKADKALYNAKTSGRNRVDLVNEIRGKSTKPEDGFSYLFC
ncbi:MAG: diguanylate cyclase [Sulfurimonas sp.]